MVGWQKYCSWDGTSVSCPSPVGLWGSLVARAVLVPIPPYSRQEEFAQPSFGIAACLSGLKCEKLQTFKTKLGKTLGQHFTLRSDPNSGLSQCCTCSWLGMLGDGPSCRPIPCLKRGCWVWSGGTPDPTQESLLQELLPAPPLSRTREWDCGEVLVLAGIASGHFTGSWEPDLENGPVKLPSFHLALFASVGKPRTAHALVPCSGANPPCAS